MLFKNHRIEVEDRVSGLWAYSLTRELTSDEAIKLWSDLRLGVEAGMVPGLEIKDVNEILVLSHQFRQKYFWAALTANERDVGGGTSQKAPCFKRCIDRKEEAKWTVDIDILNGR